MALTRYTIRLSSGSNWSEKMPTEPGLYLFRCGENDDVPEVAAIVPSGGYLFVHDEDLGRTVLSSFHYGLINTRWLHIA